ncbi:flocculation protein FLO11-like [Penaeus monodon]|uniref:flocculation protein FLO11-like n=1 Tax=Penaeus monodon TaxID=6687 RepID=UPI0018A734F1|nr:flocculation protein FLO11-like [Penaeus monodon]
MTEVVTDCYNTRFYNPLAQVYKFRSLWAGASKVILPGPWAREVLITPKAGKKNTNPHVYAKGSDKLQGNYPQRLFGFFIGLESCKPKRDYDQGGDLQKPFQGFGNRKSKTDIFGPWVIAKNTFRLKEKFWGTTGAKKYSHSLSHTFTLTPGGLLTQSFDIDFEFYSTYDVWTGIRTAITLALFFIFSVTIILYKSKCKPRRKYELYPSLEDMPGRPLDYYDYWYNSPASNDTNQKVNGVDMLGRCYDNGRGETGSAPLPKRSIGSYSSLNNSFRVKSLPGSVMRINWSRMSSSERDDVSQTHSCRSEFLRVPGVRLQSTGSSSDGYSASSSTHDLPAEINSVALLGVPGVPPRTGKPLLQLGGMDWDSDHATAEWIQTIDINVIQPTPNISPCGSVRSVSDNSELSRLPLPGRGRVQSILSLDSPDFDSRSIGSDSVFMEDSVGETCSSFSESMESGTSFMGRSPSPRNQRVVQSYRLGINPSGPASPSGTYKSPVRAPTLGNLHKPKDQRSRQKMLQRQRCEDQDNPLPGIMLSAPTMESLVLPSISSHLSASCEKLAVHSVITSESDLANSHTSLAPTSSVEEPMCAVFTVPSLRRTNSATTPQMKEEAACGFKRADSEQNPVQRADSSASHQRRSSESSTGSDASESVSFHLMVPELSIDNPSNDTSPSGSPHSSPSASPVPVRAATQKLPPRPPEPTPPPIKAGSSRPATRNERRVLRRQYSTHGPASPTLMRDEQGGHHSCRRIWKTDTDDPNQPPAPQPHILLLISVTGDSASPQSLASPLSPSTCTQTSARWSGSSHPRFTWLPATARQSSSP